MTKAFAPGFKDKMVQRLIGKDAISALQLHREVGVPPTTLSRWLAEASSLPRMTAPRRTKTWSIADKIKILSEAADVTGEQLNALLDRHGVRLFDLEQWRLALDQEGRASKAITNHVRRLEREIARKDKALAEAAALLLLKKKLHAAFGDGDDDTDEENDK